MSFCLTMLFFTPVKFLCFCVPSSHNCPLKSCSFFWFKRIEQSGRLTKFKRCRWNLCHTGDRTPTVYVIKHLERSLKHPWSICEASLRPPTRKKKTCWPLPTGVGKYPNYCLTQHIGKTNNHIYHNLQQILFQARVNIIPKKVSPNKMNLL